VALDLDLARDEFRQSFRGALESLCSADLSGTEWSKGVVNSGEAATTRRFKNGISLTKRLAFDLASLLSMGRTSSLGLLADATISIPLLRGSSRHVVAEPLAQAERHVVYAIWSFERFKRDFAVGVATDYLAVLQQQDQVKNAEENYRGLIASRRRARRLADAGRLPEIQVDQASQNELRARDRWIRDRQTLQRRLDGFKVSLGLPTDARVELDRDELDKLSASTRKALKELDKERGKPKRAAAADAPIRLEEPSRKGGPLEMDEARAISLALLHRLDLRVAQGRVFDAQRKVTVAADGLRTELTLFGSAEVGEPRSLGSAGAEDAKLRMHRGRYSGALTLDLPWERTAERTAYRDSYIVLERAVRGVQAMEDQVKLDVRNALRSLLQARESYRIQTRSVALAKRRVQSTTLFLQAGRAQIRDLLEAQEALISAQNALSAALVGYRVAELNLQRDMGLLLVDEKGLWKEYRSDERREE
jgi:outer membrane protein TolC